MEIPESLRKKVVENFLHKFKPAQMTVDNIVNEGVLFTDLNGRSVGVACGHLREGVVHTTEPYADIMVVGIDDGLLIGWIDRDKMIDADDRYLINVEALNKLPSKFKFSPECPHMSVYGGYCDEDNSWRCFGCGQVLVV